MNKIAHSRSGGVKYVKRKGVGDKETNKTLLCELQLHYVSNGEIEVTVTYLL